MLYVKAGTAKEALGTFVQRYFGNRFVIVRVNADDGPRTSGISGNKVNAPLVTLNTTVTGTFPPSDGNDQEHSGITTASMHNGNFEK